MPSERGWPHLLSCGAEKSFFWKASMTQSAAISADLRARKTPEEYMGSRKPKASPMRSQPSPAQRFEEYEKSERTWMGGMRVAFFKRGIKAGQFWISSLRVFSGLPLREVMRRSMSPTTPTETMSSGRGMYQNQPSWSFVERTRVAPVSRGLGSREAPLYWAKREALRSLGSDFFRLSFLERRALVPVASMTTLAESVCCLLFVVCGAVLVRTTPVARGSESVGVWSRRTSVTFAFCHTSAPCSL